MNRFAVIATLLQVALGSYVSVQMPYTNPAGVTYVTGEYQQHPLTYGVAPAPAHIETHHHIGYTGAQIPAVASVPYVQHVPTVSHVPVTRYEAHPAVIEKQLDVAKPAISTQKFEVRRPAIQKQFYDIEERVIIRPAGSAVVELDEPTSKTEKGGPVIETLTEIDQNPHAHNLVAHASAFGHSPSSASAIPFIAHAPVHVTVAPVISHAPVSTVQHFQPNQKPSQASEETSSQSEMENNREEAVVVENADFRRASSQENLFQSAQNQQEIASRNQEEMLHQQQSTNFRSSQMNTKTMSTPNVVVESNGIDASARRFIAHDPSPTLSVLTRSQNTQEENLNNQRRLIDLLTARGGVTEVGFGRDGESSSLIGNAGQIRARVISATPAPDSAEPSGERVSTRRVVFSRPIETLEEINVSEPATKLERISIQHPTYIHSQRLDHIQVHGSVPVIGKAYAPAIAHASVPVYQKTVTPTYGY